MSVETRELISPELLARLERLELVSRKIFRGRMKGERRSPRKGQSVEFADFRPYVPGDDLRFVDWNTYARLERLFLKMYLEEEDLHFYTLIDASGSMAFGDPEKLQYARQVAAALGFIGLTRSDRVLVETIGQTASQRGPVLRGRHNFWRLCEYLVGIEANESTSFNQGVKNFCLRNSGRGIVVLISDLMDKEGFHEGLRFLIAQQFDVYLIHVMSAEELEPDLTGDLRLIDSEDDDAADVTISVPLLRRYHQTLNAFVTDAREFCARRGITYLMTSNQRPFDELVTSYLRQRGLVR